MAREKVSTYLLLAFSILLTGNLSTLYAQDLQSFALRNGVKVLYAQDTSRPLMEVALSVGGGAIIDQPGQDGMAALWARTFWERKDDTLSYRGLAEREGIFTSAVQGLSHSQFSMRMLPGKLARGFDLMRYALEEDSYSGEDLELALRGFALELQARDGDPLAFLDEQIGRNLWQNRYPEMNPFGYYPDLTSPDPNLYRSLHRIYLHPANALLCATGPMAAESFFQVADSVLGPWTNYGPYPHRGFTAMPKMGAPTYEVYINELAQLPQMKVVWPLPGIYIDSAIVNLAQWFVETAQLQGSPFYQELIESGLANSFQWEYTPTRGPGQLTLFLVPDLDRIEQCMLGIEKSFRAYLAPSSNWLEEIDMATLGLKMQQARLLDHPQSQLFYYSRQWANGLSPFVRPWEEVPGRDELSAFVGDLLYQKSHVAGLLVNSRLAQGRNLYQVFRPAFEVAVVDEPAPDTVAAVDTVIPPPKTLDISWLEEIKIYFKPSSFDPDSLSLLGLERVSDLLGKVDTLRLFVNGYADGQGDGVYNYQLSIQRSESVKSVMEFRFGIASDRLIVRGYGEAFAEYPDDTPEHRALNRRVTFELVPPNYDPNEF